jgi:hypothetical protein
MYQQTAICFNKKETAEIQMAAKSEQSGILQPELVTNEKLRAHSQTI